MIRIYQCTKCLTNGTITYHSDRYRCPVCESSYYHQFNPYDLVTHKYVDDNFFTPDHPIAIEYKRQEKLRKFNQLTKNQSTTMLKDMLNVLVDRIDEEGANPNNNNRYNGFKVEELDLMINKLIRVRNKVVLRIENSVENTSKNDEENY